MTTTSAIARPRRRSTPVAPPLIEVPEPIFETIGVDDPKVAHGGRRRLSRGPSAPGGLVVRVRPHAELPTTVRRVKMV